LNFHFLLSATSMQGIRHSPVTGEIVPHQLCHTTFVTVVYREMSSRMNMFVYAIVSPDDTICNLGL
jgi:hypothetical protein